MNKVEIKQKKQPAQDTQEQEVKPPQTDPEKKQEEKIDTKSKSESKKEDKENGLSEDEKLLVRAEGGINLVPKKSKQEVKKEKKKFSFSVSSIISLIVLVVLSLGVVFFNIVSKQQLTSAKKEQYKKETYLQSYSDKFLSNEEILERVDLYRRVQRGVFSPREVVEYVMNIVERESTVEITSFNLTDSLEFEMSGNTSELEAVAKLWYMLGINENIVTINLSSVGKGETKVSFSFEGELETDKFINK